MKLALALLLWYALLALAFTYIFHLHVTFVVRERNVPVSWRTSLTISAIWPITVMVLVIVSLFDAFSGSSDGDL